MKTYFEIKLVRTVRFEFDPSLYESNDPREGLEQDLQNARDYTRKFFFEDGDTDVNDEITGRVVEEE
jgi:hypothetical protein